MLSILSVLYYTIQYYIILYCTVLYYDNANANANIY